MLSKIFVFIVLSLVSCGAQNYNESSDSCWQCDDKKVCIHRIKFCDGIPDCPDSSDENANCRKLIQNCPSTAFTCDYGACIRNSARCDGLFDCADGSDERNCHEKPEEHKIVQDTKEEITQIEKCQPAFRELCDGFKHCEDGSDEDPELCSRRPACPISAYRCAYGACVHGNARCNGLEDCADGSDEKDCLKKQRFNCEEPSQIPRQSQYEIVQFQGYYWLIFKCNEGFSLVEHVSYMCYNKIWYPALPKRTRDICASQKHSWFGWLRRIKRKLK